MENYLSHSNVFDVIQVAIAHFTFFIREFTDNKEFTCRLQSFGMRFPPRVGMAEVVQCCSKWCLINQGRCIEASS